MRPVPDKPSPPDDLKNLDSGWEEEEDSGVSERPTVAPPFDLESYAKQVAAPSSEVMLAAERATRGSAAPARGVLSYPRPPTTPPTDALADQLEPLPGESPGIDKPASMRAPSDTAVTMPPPAPPPMNITGKLTPPVMMNAVVMSSFDGAPAAPASEPMSRRETPRGLEQMEVARALSAREDIGTGPGTVLSLANMRVPSNLPPRAEPDDPVLTLVGEEDFRSSQTDIQTDPLGEMQERFALGDYSGALVMAESLLDENPTHVEAREYAESCRAVLQQMYTAKIGPLDRVPVVEVAREQLRWLSIDHRAGFVLSLVDGVSSLEMILDVSGMPSLDALRILYELVQQHIIAFRD
jgi:hypothetical protein